MSKTAVIYTRGNNSVEQIKKCEEYAKQQGYNIIGTTDNLEDVYLATPNVLLAYNVSRITRNSLEFYKIKNELNSKGTEIEQAV